MSKQQRDFTAAEKMDPAPSSSANLKKKRRVAPSTLLSLDCDILAMIFTFLDMFDLVHCSVVCKFWNAIIESRSLREFYQRKVKKDCSSEIPEKPLLNAILGGIAMKHHKLALQSGVCLVDQWKGHSTMVSQCRMKMGMVVTGVGDKIVGLIGSRLCIWRRNGKRSIFPAPEGTFVKGSCMRYFDPEAVIGCNDGTVRVFDMYSRRCSQIIRMHSAPITCLCLSEDQLIVSGSTSGSIAISDPSSVQQVATLRSSDCRGIRTLCFNPSSHLVFAGSAVGYTYCWDLRTRRLLWGTRVSPNVIYSLGNLQNDTSTLAVGGIDGILRFLNQNDGNIVSSFIMDYRLVSTSQSSSGFIQRRKARRLPENTHINIDLIPMAVRPSITCLVVGMKKIVTTHNTNDIRLWKFK
ncbi:PREDICTED: F-box/WD-40 repeat-containing protein At3g52030 isoform X2 [Lupinus angustifolius]|uniref:F-box/WD-40 repeat-containing protein At3g52030 isoform X2 n=1 Tax=Lupinus angustifolius TaxID=3871 RepID=UPI00092F98D7|nr:PREDICTED: F-box/WD-40 repeat-containing protein At3g52030 isoform X2 [Lupinus angustifolius]